jgi:hypothetical protein
MHCPKCGQQQISEEVRFCSRCGFPLEGVMRLVASGGMLQALGRVADEQQQQTGALTPNQRGKRRGMKLVFWAVALTPIFFGLCFPVDSPGPLIIPATIFLVGLLQIIYAWIFGEEMLPARSGKRGSQSPVQVFMIPDEHAALPPSRSAPVSDPFRPRTNTAEIIHPPASVTEQTTRLLDDK